MRKILIAFLGNSNYEETSYLIEGKSYKSRLAFIPIQSHFSPIETTYVIGTRESKWEMVGELPHTPILIPYCRREEDFWELFDILTTAIDLRQSQVIVDITHCFRSIPVFAALYVRFVRSIEPTANFSHLLYGAYEREAPETPLINLVPILELLDWADATSSFIRYGELEGLTHLIRNRSDSIWKSGQGQKPTKLGSLSSKLEALSNLAGLTYVPLLPAISREISEGLRDDTCKNEISQHVKPIGLIVDRLIEHVERFSRPSHWESHLAAAGWYLENNRQSQAIIVLREAIVTYLCEQDKCDVYDLEERKKREDYLNDRRERSNEPIVVLWQRVTDARNRVGHALMKKTNKEISPGKAVRQVKELIKQAQEVLGESH